MYTFVIRPPCALCLFVVIVSAVAIMDVQSTELKLQIFMDCSFYLYKEINNKNIFFIIITLKAVLAVK